MDTKERAITTGRIVPRDVLEAAIEQVPRSVNILGPLVDYYAEILNAQGAPDVVLTKPTGSTWVCMSAHIACIFSPHLTYCLYTIKGRIPKSVEPVSTVDQH